MGILSLDDFKRVPDGYKNGLLVLFIGYTLILGGIIFTIVKNLDGSASELNCDTWASVYYTNATNSGGANEMTFYLNSVVGSRSTLMCTSGTTDLIDSYSISPFTTFCGVGIFCVYLFHGLTVLSDANLLRETLKRSEGGISAQDDWLIWTIANCGALQMLFVEIGGLSLISTSSSAVDLLINSSATIFLAEVDDIVAQIILRYAAKSMELKITLDYCGIEFEHDPQLAKAAVTAPTTPVVSELHNETGGVKATEMKSRP